MDERRIAAASRAELERRWQAVRQLLRERGVDVLVMVGGDALLSGYIRWFTDSPVIYRKVVAFHADGPMTLIEHGAAGTERSLDGNDPNYPGVGEVIGVAEFASVNYCQDHEAVALLKVLKRRGARAVGLLNPDAMPHGFVRMLQAGLADTVFHDLTDPVDRLKAIKSDEELALIARAAALQDTCFARALRELRPGMRDSEVAGLLQHEGRLHGSETGMVLAGSARMGEPAVFQTENRQGRVLGAGDCVSMLIENTGPGGYYLELSRHVVLGRASAEMLEAFEIVKQAQAHTLSLCKPGTRFADIYAAHNAYMARLGQPPERRVYAHGQGYDMVERPLVRDDEPMTVEAGMCLAVHPSYMVPGLWVAVTDNYIIGADGAGERLQRTEQQVFEIQ